MAEWSKATDLSSVIFGCAGSNPAGVICPVSSDRLEHLAFNQRVAGSSPARGSNILECKNFRIYMNKQQKFLNQTFYF